MPRTRDSDNVQPSCTGTPAIRVARPPVFRALRELPSLIARRGPATFGCRFARCISGRARNQFGTVSWLDLDFAVFTHDACQVQAIRGEASTMRRLGMSLRAIGAALGVDEKTVRRALAGLAF